MAALVPALSAAPVTDDEKAVIAKFLVGYAALWIVLTAGTESKSLSGPAAALAVSLAAGATILFFARGTANLGLSGTMPGSTGG